MGSPGRSGILPVTFTGGLNYESMSENRKGYNNFRLNNGTLSLGIKAIYAGMSVT